MKSYSLWNLMVSMSLFGWILGCQRDHQPFGYGEKNGLVVDRIHRFVDLDGSIYPERYNRDPERACGHHAITWQGGGRARQALIETRASDYEVAVALRTLGARAGRPLPQDVWSERHDQQSPYPDWRAEGARINIDITWQGSKGWIPLSDLLIDRHHQELDIRFEGQEELISVWKSGCIVCLASCPGAKASNAHYTIRDQINGAMDFHLDLDCAPPDGTEVKVRLSVLPNE